MGQNPTGQNRDGSGLPEEGDENTDPLGSASQPASSAEAGKVEQDPAPDQDQISVDDVLTQTAKERDDYLDSLRRLQAEFENYKKRVAKQSVEQGQRAAEHLIMKLLPVLDTMDLALSHDPSGSLEQVTSALHDALVAEKVETIADTGVRFDPTVHDAVAHEEGDGEAEVIEVMRAGYRYNGKVLRPAMVKVKGS